ncbi:MAG: D-glycerate dehydrogenase [Bacillota bacterium]|nr:D-glycerate dehydrogenase [Bacillota bacterium]
MKIFFSHRVQGDIDDLLLPDCEIIINPYERTLTPDEVKPLLADMDGILWASGKMDRSIMDAAPKLKVICCYGAGSDHIDVTHATERGIVVANLPDHVTESTAELTWALILAAARRITEADRFVRQQDKYEWSLRLMVGTHLCGKQLGIIGMGRIGQAVARRAQAFAMSVAYYSRTAKPDVEKSLAARPMDLETLLSTSDVISVHVPLTPETRHLISEKELALMKPGAILINAARGSIVDQAALIQTLAQNKIRAAGLDVYEQEPFVPQVLREMDQVVLAPHIGSATNESRSAMTRAALENILLVLQDKRPASVVNPEVYAS